MANPIYITYTTTGTKTGVPLDYLPAPFNATFQTVVGTAANYKMQYTLGDPNDGNASWVDDAVIASGTTASALTTYTTPIRAVRLIISSITGNLFFNILQGHPAS